MKKVKNKPKTPVTGFVKVTSDVGKYRVFNKRGFGYLQTLKSVNSKNGVQSKVSPARVNQQFSGVQTKSVTQDYLRGIKTGIDLSFPALQQKSPVQAKKLLLLRQKLRTQPTMQQSQGFVPSMDYNTYFGSEE